MTYVATLDTLNRTNAAFRVCVGGKAFKQLKGFETRAMDIQRKAVMLQTAMHQNSTATTVKDLKAAAPNLATGELEKYLKKDTVQLKEVLNSMRIDVVRLIDQIRKITTSKAGSAELYGRLLSAKAEFTRMHFNMDAPSLEESLMNNAAWVSGMRDIVTQIDKLMAESDYRNQQGITHADYERNTRELYSLDLIAKNYTAESAKLLPECEILKPTPMWQYVGVGHEPIKIRADQLQELMERFLNVPGVTELLVAADRLKEKHSKSDVAVETPPADPNDLVSKGRGRAANVMYVDEAPYAVGGDLREKAD